jgi:type IV secretion system protein VirB5
MCNDPTSSKESFMKIRGIHSVLVILILSIASVSTARAQWAVVDAPAIVQLIQEVEDLEEVIATARNQLQQAKQALQTMTGDRGMEMLLSGTVRNYLPSGWQQLANAVQGGGGGGALAADIQNNVVANSVLSPQRLATLSPDSQRLIQATRQWGAARQSIAHQALANSSNRFSSLQTLISTIGSAGDQKAILDLQARINAELGMLQNEQTKLQVLNQSLLAQQSTLSQQSREMAIEAHGHFDTRFQPTP